PDVPGQLLARARARPRSAQERPRLDDREDAAPGGGAANEPLGLGQGAGREDRDPPLLPGSRAVHRPGEVRTDAPRERDLARALRRGAPGRPPAPEIWRPRQSVR